VNVNSNAANTIVNTTLFRGIVNLATEDASALTVSSNGISVASLNASWSSTIRGTYIDSPGAGTHTYSVQAIANNATLAMTNLSQLTITRLT
jgi:hypothetical protein